MKLPPDDFVLLYDAMLDAFKEDSELDIVSKAALNLHLNEIGPPAILDQQVTRIISRAESYDRIEELITQARKRNSFNEKLLEAENQLLKKLRLQRVRNSIAPEPPDGQAPRDPSYSGDRLLQVPEQKGLSQPPLEVIQKQPANSSRGVGGTSWADAPDIESRLSRALDSFNWTEAESICDEVIKRLRTVIEPFPERSATWLLNLLRRKRRFEIMARLAETLIGAGLGGPEIRRQYAQALIDQGALSASEAVLQSIIQDSKTPESEKLEAHGLMGRIHKQVYLDYAPSPRTRGSLERAIEEYATVYKLDPKNHLWHGINVLALTARARRDNVFIPLLPDEESLAKDILAAIGKREHEATEPLPAWDVATRLEAYVALNRNLEAGNEALRYVDSFGTDAFEFDSTLKQLTAVWQLNDREPPGSQILPILRAAFLKRQGASVELNTERPQDGSAIDSANKAIKGLSAIFGHEKSTTLKWYKKGLDQCNSIARVEKRTGKGIGTGWLVNAADFFPDQQGVLLLTVNHVVSPSPNPLAIFPNECQINFQAEGEVFEVEDKVVWYSSYLDLDATFLKLKGEPKAPPLTLHDKRIEMSLPPPRLYIIGHPSGRGLELSMQDNQLLASNETLLHYRTPTEPGSGGSPVFEPDNWRVVGLHHKGNHEMSRIDGVPGTYRANEGISILAIQKATRGL